MGVLKRMTRLFMAVTAAFLLILITVAAQAAPIGIVKTVGGDTRIVRDGQTVSPEVGADVFLNDNVATGGDGSIGISFNDSTTVSLGGDSELKIDRFVYEPATKNVGLGMEMLAGTFTYLSGKIAAIDAETVQLATPSMIIGIRGTKFLLKVKKQN